MLQTESVLLERARNLAGQTLEQIASQLNISVPQNLLHHKGWVGDLLEKILGTTAGNRSLPDFMELGIELKTLPINRQGRVLETTYISITPLTKLHTVNFENSEFLGKLKKILWVPIISERRMLIKERMIAAPFLWSPGEEDYQILKNDWQEMMDMIALGRLDKITAYYGVYLQLRPKAANGRSLTEAFDEEGGRCQTLPRGFYLRTCFTQKIMNQQFNLV